ncbi:MAG: SUMF1/EgtB/PvdO family nonheme iron enzyme [Prevotellaceae bacterium]|nr:SUMF1/EgtB/PvdO family nonheme iron enzyme [Prevotellaceae bacterium]
MKKKIYLAVAAIATMGTVSSVFTACKEEENKPKNVFVDTSDPFDIEFVQVEGGTVALGSGTTQHQAILDDYAISKYEITQSQWESVMGEGNEHGYWVTVFGEGNNFPAYRISWNDVQQFLNKLNTSQTEYAYTLPTEAEWEYAARGGKESQNYLYSGSNDIANVAWYKNNSSVRYNENIELSISASHLVGQKTANELGLFDMSGNVWEFCSDFAGGKIKKDSIYNNPKGPASGTACVIRGGSSFSTDSICRVTSGSSIALDERNDFVGFRLVRKPYVAIADISLDQDTIILYAGKTQQLIANISPARVSYNNVTWASSKTAVATVDANGLVKAVAPDAKKLAADTAIITVTAKDGGKTAKCVVIVPVVDVESVILDKIELDTYVGEKGLQLTATIAPDTASFKTLKWKSSDTTIVAVDSINGKLTAKKAGTTVITVTTSNGLTATCEITVAPYMAITSVALNKTSIEIKEGETELLSATVLPANASNPKITWSSDNSAVAAVSNSGLVLALTAGTAKITVTTEDGNKKAVCNVKVVK